MKTFLTAILTLTIALSPLGAVDLMRPLVELTPTPDGVQVTFNFERISSEQWRQLLSDPETFFEYGYGVSGQPGDAALPLLTQLIPMRSAVDVQINSVERVESRLLNPGLKASPAGHLDSDSQAELVQDYDWSRSRSAQPDDLILGEPVAMQGAWFLPVTYRPVRLDPGTEQILIPSRITLELGGLELSNKVTLTAAGDLRSVGDLDEIYAPKGRYLIVTPAVFAPYVSFLADWKLRMGYEVDVVTTATTGSTASAIKSYIQGIWDAGEARPDYLLLIGDEDQGIPGHYILNPEGTNLVTDHPYGLMEGDDSFPEIMVGRLSVDTSSELAAFMSKIINYESNPYMGVTSWFRRALMISTTAGAASAQATKEWVAAKLTENGFTQVYTAYAPMQSSTNYISSPINQGVGFVNYRGFGAYNGWYGPNFTSYDITSSISNGAKTPVITSVVCGGGNFAAWGGDDPCFGEVWTRIGTSSVPRGAVAFFGPSELYTHTQFNNVIDIGIYSGIFDQGITTLGKALWNGKFELWRNYHDNTYYPFGQTPEFYHHIYNLLGDPGMQLWTDVPELLSVTHPSSRDTGDNALPVTVMDQAGEPVKGAYVALYNSNFAIGGTTNAAGTIVLPFHMDQLGQVELTITGKNLHPYLATIPVLEDPHPLLLNSWTLAGEEVLIPASTRTMHLEFYNSGETLSDVNLTFTSTTPGITVTNSVVIADLPGLETTVVESALISADASFNHGDLIELDLDILADGQSWSLSGQFVVQAPVLDITDLNFTGAAPLAGDSAAVVLEVTNRGGVMSGPLTLTLLPHDLVWMVASSMDCPAVDVDGSVVTPDPQTLYLSDQVFPGEELVLAFRCEQAGRVDTLEYGLTSGAVTPYGPSPADAYGYRMFDNMDLSYSKAEAYDWIEMDPAFGGSGSVLPISDYYAEADASTTLLLPFSVQYYGEVYNQITVCSNGWAAFGAQSVVDFHNRTIPSPIGPTAMLAPFWDDLITTSGYVVQGYSATAGAFILEWTHVRHLNYGNSLTFQIIIYDTALQPTLSGDNDIKFQYKDYSNLDVAANFNTVGIESPNSADGILVSYNGSSNGSIPHLASQVALLFSTDRGERLPAAMAALSQTSLHFTQNPWTTARDSIILTNVGESSLAYSFSMDTEVLNIPPPPQFFVDSDLTKSAPDAAPRTGVERDGGDAFGYTWVSSTEANAPAYAWIDIETPENVLPYGGDPDDGSTGPVAIGFDFPFYEQVYSQMYIGSNGTISFESSASPWNNNFLPATGAPPALLAPWWEDLNTDGGLLGTLYLWTNGFNQCIITYKDFPKWGTSLTYTFQVILEPFGKIVYQYQTLNGPTTSVTVGMQNSAGNIGFMVHYNESTLFEAGQAITIRRPVDWFSATGWSGVIPGGESAAFVVDIRTQNLDPGHYELPMTLSSSADNLTQTPILVSMDLVLGQPPPGDVNQDYLVDVNDLMEMLDFILLIESMNEDQFGLADISADDSVDVIDVVLLIEGILSTE